MEEARRLFELLNKELVAILALSEENTKQQHLLATQENLIQEKSRDLEAKTIKLGQERQLFDGEKEFLTKKAAEVHAKTIQLESKEQQAKETLVSLELKEAEIRKQQAALDLKITLADDIEARLAKVEEREQIVDKKEAINKSRNEMLDIREEALNKAAKPKEPTN